MEVAARRAQTARIIVAEDRIRALIMDFRRYVSRLEKRKKQAGLAEGRKEMGPSDDGGYGGVCRLKYRRESGV
jgi:hypothetical protein